MVFKNEWGEFKKEIPFFALGVIAGWALIILLIQVMGTSLTNYFEDVLRIPFNIHHDLIGLLGLIGLWIFRKKFGPRDKWALAGFFIGLFTQAIVFEGIQLITPF